MSFSFDAHQGLIVVPTRVWGPTGETVVRLALDTGATWSLLAPATLVSLGYDPARTLERVRITTGSGVEFVSSLLVNKVEALGLSRAGFPVIAHTLPPSASVDGLLGLDFLRGHRLTIDFRTGRLHLD